MNEFFERMLDIFLDPWVLFGFSAQFIFFLRFAVQMFASEKAGKSVIPMAFWYLSIVGAIMILIYSIHIQDPVFIVAQSLSLIIYLRNIVLRFKEKRETETNSEQKKEEIQGEA